MNIHSKLKLTTLLTVITLAATAHAQSEIKIAYNGDLSGSPSSASGLAAVVGIQAALDDINAAGGVLGRKLQLITRDDTGQPPKSIQNVVELIDNEKVAVIMGPNNSGNAMAFKHIPTQKKMPVMGCAALGTAITRPMSPGADNYMFRVSMTDRYAISMLLAYAKKNPKTKNLGVIAETTGYGASALEDIQEISALQGLKIAAIERVGVADTDMTSPLNKMKAANVDTLIVWAQGTPLAQAMRSMEKINYFPLVLPSTATDNASFLDAAGKSLGESVFMTRALPAPFTPNVKAHFDRVAAKLPTPAAFPAAVNCYDATLLVVQALRQAGSTDGVAIKNALEDLKVPVKGLLKTYSKPFSKTEREGIAPTDYYWQKWKDGKIVSYSDAVTKSFVASDFKK